MRFDDKSIPCRTVRRGRLLAVLVVALTTSSIGIVEQEAVAGNESPR